MTVKFILSVVHIQNGVNTDLSILDHIHDPQLETHEVIAGRGTCINDGQKIEYVPGVISVMPSKIHHEVHADEEGLFLFAKFMPALV